MTNTKNTPGHIEPVHYRMIDTAIRMAYVEGALCMAVISLGVYLLNYGFLLWMGPVALGTMLTVGLVEHRRRQFLRWVKEDLGDE